jgi:hypothetical protein
VLVAKKKQVLQKTVVSCLLFLVQKVHTYDVFRWRKKTQRVPVDLSLMKDPLLELPKRCFKEAKKGWQFKKENKAISHFIQKVKNTKFKKISDFFQILQI